MRSLLFIFLLTLSVTSTAEMPEFKGDIRYRIDRTDQDNTDSRLRQRIRGRIGIYGNISPSLAYGFRLASGDDNSPTSTNTTLDGGFSSKSIYFDRIYISYDLIENLKLIAGKTENPFYRPGKSNMLFDGDLSPEGVALKYDRSSFFANAAYSILEERSTGPDTSMIGIQMGSQFKINATNIKCGLGYYGYMALQNHLPLVDTTNSKGNTIDGGGAYLHDYDIVQAFASIKYKPFKVFFDYIQNRAVNANRTGWIAGGSYSKDSIIAFYNYRKLKKDAAVGALVDSDFGGGGTDKKGHVFGIGYYFTKNSRASLTHFLSKTAVTGGATYHRSFLDYQLNF